MNILFTNTRRSVYKALYAFDQILDRKMNIVVLCYHDVSNSGWTHAVSLTNFKKQINYLSQNYNFISAQDLEEFLLKGKKLPKKSILITFDDGCKSIFDISDYLISKRVKPVAFVLTDSENADFSQIGVNKSQLLSNSEIKKLSKKGWTIGSHSSTHKDFNRLKSDTENETTHSVKQLEKTIGERVKYFAYPKGRYNQEIVSKLADANVKLAFTMDDSKISERTNRLKIPRVAINNTHTFDEFKASFSPSVVLFRSLVKKFV